MVVKRQNVELGVEERAATSAVSEPIDSGVHRIIATVCAELRRRAGETSDVSDRRHFFAAALKLAALRDSALGRLTLQQPRIALELSAHLERYLTIRRALHHDPAYGDLLLRAAVTAVQVAIGLGHWRANSNVPAPVRELLKADDIYRCILEVERLEPCDPLARLIDLYSSTITALNGDGRGETGIKVRKPVLWMWCKFNIKNVAHPFAPRRWPLAACDERLRDAIADAKVMLVIFNVVLDDVSDVLQDRELFALMSRIPTAAGRFGVATPADYARLRAQLGDIGRERFAGYFDLAVEIWVTALTSLAALTGDGYRELEAQLGSDYELVLSSMRLSVDINLEPQEIFYLSPVELKRRYGEETIGDVLAHNANVAAFFTIDLMCLRNLDRERYRQLVLSGAIDLCRRAALISQDMLQLGNSVATGAREIGADDLSNELFKIANDLLNERDDWEQPAHLRHLPRRDLLLALFMRKRSLRRVDTTAAAREYAALGEDIKQLFDRSGAERHYFCRWLRQRDQQAQVCAEAGDLIDPEQVRRADELLLVMHLIYKGSI